MQSDNVNSSDFPTLERLRQVLPKDRRYDPNGEQLAKLLQQISLQKVPVGSFSRIWLLGSLQAKVTGGYLAYWLRSCFASAEQKVVMKNEAHLRAALQLFGTMGYLRGAVMKVGQMLASLPEVLPEEFAEVLAALHFQAPAMHYSLVREVFLDEFGREPEALFASFERQAFAAASLGQVHRARLHSGQQVAVKIQYPDIARTIRSDLRNLRLLLQPMCMTKDWRYLLEKLTDLEQMLVMETDYRQEAHFTKEIRGLFTPSEQIVIPEVFEAYSTGRVLTTEYIPGRHLEDFLAGEPDQALCDHFTELLTAATMRPLYHKRLLLADPNPGNYIFMDDGRLGLIDFGCTRILTEEEEQLQHEFELAVMAGDDCKIDQMLAQTCYFDTVEEMEPERLRVVGQGARWQMEPWTKEGLFDFGDRDFFRRGVEATMELCRKGYSRGAPTWIWANRFILGARGVVYRLRGRCDFHKLYAREMALLQTGERLPDRKIHTES